MKIRNYRFTPEDVDCRYCVKYLHGRCRAGICPWINERVEAGTVDYREAVDETFLEYLPLRRRAKLVSATASNRFWRDDAHRERFAMAQAIFGWYKRRNTPAYYAALFLLTSNRELFERCADCFTRSRIDFRFATLRGISTDNYVLFKTAKSLYLDSAEVGVDELADPELVGIEPFRLVINAMLIRRYGLSATGLQDEGMDHGIF